MMLTWEKFKTLWRVRFEIRMMWVNWRHGDTFKIIFLSIRWRYHI